MLYSRRGFGLTLALSSLAISSMMREQVWSAQVRDGWQNVTSSCANRTDVVDLDHSVEIAAGRAADGADASFCNGPKCFVITDTCRGCGSLR